MNPSLDPSNTFPTKNGFCHVLPDKLVLTRDGNVEQALEKAVGNRIFSMLLMYGGITVAIAYFSVRGFSSGEVAQGLYLALVALFLGLGLFSSLNNSTIPVIERRAISSVKYRRGMLGLTRSRFVVYFKNERGNVKKRLIMLPGTLAGGREAAKEALELMKKQGYYSA
ncbi:MAG TPA: phosphoribosylaminoimidazolesuccinocarboxamide synthase [Cytophagales bacterium]|nr:phosphoribosylaminoimidazolesuccinocarboxamide synthase [Cytophagales bacterium]HAA22174.1 phosphoribosylaminoimidazolesuccinocarboxamide synthase [Cytophagales bacterium]HAP65097.1 phosphoribosylaminoimidazolesuccinocarboxamide synthase [Cytophagales bacterium]